MKITWLNFILLLISGAFAIQPDVKLRRHFQSLSDRRHPYYRKGVAWLQARKYIIDKFYEFGLTEIEKQKFNTTVSGEKVEGVNIIGVKEGEDTTGPIILIGADYSTAESGNYLKNNTGGVACLLETVHLFLHNVLWESYHQNFTVLFVAFDLNTREYHESGMGMPGAYYFVHDWLAEYLHNRKEHRQFMGAIILDSVTTYNTQNRSQLFRQGFDEAMPEASANIRMRGRKGDFLGLVYKSQDEQSPLLETFYENYYKERILRPYVLQKMKLSPSVETSDSIMDMISHQSHYQFWTKKIHHESLPAFLLFDTEGDRVDPTPDVCGEISCDVDRFLTPERMEFMEHTTRTLVRTLISLQTTYDDSSSATQVSVPLTVVIISSSILAFILNQ